MGNKYAIVFPLPVGAQIQRSLSFIDPPPDFRHVSACTGKHETSPLASSTLLKESFNPAKSFRVISGPLRTLD